MSNMSYCRFENTADDLEDCVSVLEENSGDISTLSESELNAALRLLDLAHEIVDQYSDAMTKSAEDDY